MQMNRQLRHYELLVLDRMSIRVEVRVNTNPLLKLPGIYLKTSYRINVFTQAR